MRFRLGGRLVDVAGYAAVSPRILDEILDGAQVAVAGCIAGTIEPGAHAPKCRQGRLAGGDAAVIAYVVLSASTPITGAYWAAAVTQHISANVRARPGKNIAPCR